MTGKDKIRQDIWRELRKVARPDSRFHWNFGEFIADYEGSDQCADRIREMDVYRQAKIVFITPDNNLAILREYAILDDKVMLVTTYGITRGTLLLRPQDVPEGQAKYAATLDGLDYLAKPVSLRDIQALGRIDLLVTGASAISRNGVRFGKGHGFFDIEWAMFLEIGVVSEETPVIAVGHDCQVVEADIEPTEFDTLVDYIVTPTRTLKVDRKHPKPKGIFWEKLPNEMLAQIPPLEELKRMQRTAG